MREEGVDEREQPAEEHRHQEPDHPAPAPDRAPDAEEGAHQHHPFEPDVHDARALGEDPAHRREGERRREAERRSQHAHREDAVEGLRILCLEPDRAQRPRDPEADRPPTELALAAGDDGDPARERGESRHRAALLPSGRPGRQRQPEGQNPAGDADDRDRPGLGQPPNTVTPGRCPGLRAHGIGSGCALDPGRTSFLARQM